MLRNLNTKKQSHPLHYDVTEAPPTIHFMTNSVRIIRDKYQTTLLTVLFAFDSVRFLANFWSNTEQQFRLKSHVTSRLFNIYSNFMNFLDIENVPG